VPSRVPFDRRVATLAHDHSSSSTSISLQLLDAVVSYVSNLSMVDWDEGVGHVVGRIRQLSLTQSSMPQIAAISQRIEEEVTGRQNARKDLKRSLIARLTSLKGAVTESRRSVAENIASLLQPDSTVLTLSYSSEVLEGIERAHALGRVRLVLVAESRPGKEGIALLRALRSKGITARLIPDAALAGAACVSDLGLVGADSVNMAGSVTCKVGSRLLALACRECGRPFYVTCSSFKITQGKESGEVGREHFTKPGSRGTSLFESTRSTLISGYVTEEGVLSYSQFRRLWGGQRHSVPLAGKDIK